MLKYKILLPISAILIIFLTIVDFFLFSLWPKLEFIIHNIAALAVGAALVIISYKILASKSRCKMRDKSARHQLLYLNIVVGLVMIAVHITKLIIGQCI